MSDLSPHVTVRNRSPCSARPPHTQHKTPACSAGLKKAIINTRKTLQSTFGPADFYEVHHVLMLEQLEDFNLSQGCDGKLEKRKRECRLEVQETRPSLPREQERCDHAAWQVLPSSPHLPHSHQDMIQPSLSCRTASLAVAFAVQGVNSLPNP